MVLCSLQDLALKKVAVGVLVVLYSLREASFQLMKVDLGAYRQAALYSLALKKGQKEACRQEALGFFLEVALEVEVLLHYLFHPFHKTP